MPKDYPRSERIASQIQRELATLVQHSVKDPRLSSPSILEVQVSKDLSQAKVYFSVLNPDAAPQSLTVLNRASGFLQREIGKVLKARITPKLKFIYDDSNLRGRNLSDLIDSAVAQDQSRSGE
ncbi:MAG: 30S ribosome-binding factor RbfA [Gammaproteobacteria bacterium]|nr:30S ribosome-binding factor RbfA [Gammaproteobacteria bacterium]